MFKPVKLLGEIMALAYLVNRNTDYCTFVDYSGHVEELSIRIRQSKTKPDREIVLHNLNFYIDNRHGTNSGRELLNAKSILESYLYPNTEELVATLNA